MGDKLYPAYLFLFGFMGILALLVPVLFALRYRYYVRQFQDTPYLKPFRVGWPFTAIACELISILGITTGAWSLKWLPLDWVQMLLGGGALCVSALVCLGVGTVQTQEGFHFLRALRAGG